MMICSIIMMGVLLLAFYLMGAGSGLLGIVFLMLGVLGCLFFYQSSVGSSMKTYRALYKNEIISRIATHIEPSLAYSPSNGISKRKFREIGHYSGRIDRYKTEDFFQGKRDLTELYFAEIHAEYKTTSRDSKGNTRTTWHTLFKGVFFAADFHKDFNTWVKVRPDKESGVFGWIGTKMQKLSSSHIRMENAEFEENFKVNAGNDQEARYILTPNMQERLLNLKKYYNVDVIVSFKNGSVYITMPQKNDWFESSIFKSALSEKQIESL